MSEYSQHLFHITAKGGLYSVSLSMHVLQHKQDSISLS